MSQIPLEIIASNGALRIFPALQVLQEALVFNRMEMGVTEFPVTCRTTGKIKMITKRSNRPVQVKESLHYIGDDGALYTHEGLYPRICAFLDQFGIPHTFASHTRRMEPSPTPEAIRDLRPQQIECLSELLCREMGSVNAPTGYGKTRVIAGIIRSFPTAKIVVTTQRVSVVQTLCRELQTLLVDDGVAVGVMSGSIKAPQRVTVCTNGCLDFFVEEDVDVLIFDEVHKSASKEISNIIMKFGASRRYGLSGTLGKRFDNKNIFMEAMFGPIVYEMTDEAAEEAGIVCPMHLYNISVPSGPNVSLYKDPLKKEKLGIWFNQERNGRIQRVVSRIPQNQQTIIFVRTIEHLEHLKEKYLPDFEVFHSGLGTKKKRELQEKFESGEILRMIATNSMSEGVDPKNLYVEIDANWVTSEQEVIQRAGRNRRWGTGGKSQKPFAVLVGFRDEWDGFMSRKAVSRLEKYTQRGYVIHDFAEPEQIVFVGGSEEILY